MIAKHKENNWICKRKMKERQTSENENSIFWFVWPRGSMGVIPLEALLYASQKTNQNKRKQIKTKEQGSK